MQDETKAALEIADLKHRLSNLERITIELRNRENSIDKILEDMQIAAGRWRGGFMVLVALGGIITWIAQLGPGIKAWLGK